MLILGKGHVCIPKERSGLPGEMDGLLEYLGTTIRSSNIGLHHNGKNDKRKWWMVSFMPDTWQERLNSSITQVDRVVKTLLGPTYESDCSPSIVYNHGKSPRYD